MTHLIERLHETARALAVRVVFPEADDPRVLAAADMLARKGIVAPVLIGNAAAIRRTAQATGIDLDSLVAVIDPMLDLPPGTPPGASDLEPLVLSAMLVRNGHVDACIAGAVHSTRKVLRTAIDVIGLAPSVRLVSSVFLMVLPDGRAVTFGDCAVVPVPNTEQLADIAVRAAATHRRLTGEVPHVAMLSFATKGSAEHETVVRVREATDIARRVAPDILIDGELQFDAAWVPDVAARKAASSPVAGRANVFIFPNLEAGNIAYKIAERLGGAQAIGPILQGLAKPMHDLSRGCRVDDIVTLTAIAALQAHVPDGVARNPAT